jgi:hypothetical protein
MIPVQTVTEMVSASGSLHVAVKLGRRIPYNLQVQFGSTEDTAQVHECGGQLFCDPRNRRVLTTNLLMLRSSSSESKWSESKVKFSSRLRCGRIQVVCLCLFVAIAVALPSASAQTDFTMTVSSSLSPDAVAPGGTSSANITIVTGSSFVGPITFGCTVTPSVGGTVSNPVCTVSPTTLSASGGASATLTTTATTTTVSYGITITATDSSGTVTSPTLNLTVLSVTPQFTVTVTSAISPNKVPAGSGAEGEVTVTPVNGYSTPSGGITLYCASMTPLVTIPPWCVFTYPNNSFLTVSGDSSATATITINTWGPAITSAPHGNSRRFYALWLSLPMFGFTFLGTALGSRRSRKAWVLFALFVMSASLLLLPACSNTTTQTTTPNGTTPPNTYTFTIVGVDSNGVASSNTGSTGSAGPSVTLTVTAPTT